MFDAVSGRFLKTSSSRECSRRKLGRGRWAEAAGQVHIEGLEERRLLSGILGSAESFAVLAGSAITNTGPTVILGDVGIWPNDGNSISGFPPALVSAPGQTHAGDAVAQQAEADAMTAYNTLAGLPPTVNLTGQDLGGLTLTPGVYKFDTSAQLTGTLTLDAQNDPNAQFVFQIGSTLTTASASSVQLINASPCFSNDFWQVGSSATLGTATEFKGTILALTSITLTTAANITNGRALAINGAVTLDTNNINILVCGTISGIKFEDTNGDGIRQAGEPGLPGLTIYLDANTNSAFDAGEQSTTTDANGNYLFTGINIGTYSVRQVVPAGWTLTTTAPASVTVTSSEDVAGGDFGDFLPGQITGTTYRDVCGNGFPGKQGTPAGGVRINLYQDRNGNGVVDSGDGVPISTIVSAANGVYSFGGLTHGSYLVQEIVPRGHVRTGPALSSSYALGIASGSVITGQDYYNYRMEKSYAKNITYSVTHKGVTTKYLSLAGNVQRGDTVKMHFVVMKGRTAWVSLASYKAPRGDLPAIHEGKEAEFGAGKHTLTVTIPKTTFRVYAASGYVVWAFGPAGSNINYTSQKRLFSTARIV